MISSEKLLIKYSPKNCLKHAGKIKTVEMAITTNAFSIGTFHREKGRDFTEGWVLLWLIYLNSMLNLNKPMTEDQLEMCATEIVNEYYGLKITDLSLLFKRIISGAYGEFYESLSIPKVLSFFALYFEERCKIAEELSLRNHNDIKSVDEFNLSKNVRRLVTTNSNRFIQ